MARKLNEGLKERQESLRQETCEAIENAIIELMEEGFEVSTKLLMERTGLSRPVFGKEHALKILKKYRVCRFKDLKMVSKDNDKNYIVDLEKQVRSLTRECDKANEMLSSAIKRNTKLELEVADLKETNEILRGQLKTYYEKALSFGIDLE